MSTARVDISNTFGAGLLGAMITAMLYGLTTLQTYLYFVYYPKDRPRTQLLVSSIWCIDTVHMALVIICMYHYLVANYSNPSALKTGHWSLFASVAMNVLTAVIVQSYFATQIYTLCEQKIRRWVTSVIFLCVIAHFCFGMESVAFLFVKKDFESFQQPRVTVEAAMPFAIFAVLSDILISIALSVLLHRNRSGIASTNKLISTLIIYAINRCLLTSVVAVAETIAFALSPKSLWFLAIDFAIGKLYANSLLASLNSRNSLRASASTVVDSDSRPVSTGMAFQSDRSGGSSSGGETSRKREINPAVISLQTGTTETNTRGSRRSDEAFELAKV